MIPTNAVTSSGLTWSKIPHSRDYEFQLSGGCRGTLQHTSFWSSNFVAEIGASRWLFRRSGFFGAEIVDTVTGPVFANFKQGWGSKGTLTFSDGTHFQLVAKGCWSPVWTLSQDGHPVLSMRPRDKQAEIYDRRGASPDRLLLLTMFTLYRVLQGEEAAAAVIAAS